MEDDERVADYATRFNKVLKGVDYNNNFTVKMRVRKFINGLTDRLAELTQVQNPATLEAALEAVTSAEMASIRRNGRRSNVHMIETITALKNQVEVLQTEVRSKPLTPAELQKGMWDQIREGRSRGRGGFRGSFRGRGGSRGGIASYNQGRGEC